MKSEILTTEAAILRILPAWRELYRRAGTNLFSHPDFYIAWWKHLGKAAGWQWHVAVLWDENRLVAITPLAVINKKGLRVLQWAGIDVLDYNETLTESPLHAHPVWHAVRHSKRYDFAIIKDVLYDAPCQSELKKIARPLRKSRAFYIPLEWPDSEAWLKSLPYDRRKEYKRRLKQLQAMGTLQYEVIDKTPSCNAVTTLVTQKREWCRQQARRGVFDLRGIEDFLLEIAHIAASENCLHLSILRCGEEPIAAHLGFVHRGALCWYAISYAQDWARFSPGRVMMYKGIAWAIDNGLKEFDLLRGGENYKYALTESAKVLMDYSFGRGIKGKLAGWMQARKWAYEEDAEATV
ncbi:MAG: GNAT family N-acetyltransferase [Rickettsiales bacterium]